ncbi:hypothetical protein BgiMline_027769, partial [Biomphalaria glabrata]
MVYLPCPFPLCSADPVEHRVTPTAHTNTPGLCSTCLFSVNITGTLCVAIMDA